MRKRRKKVQANKRRLLKFYQESVGHSKNWEFNMFEVETRSRVARNAVERNHITEGVTGHVGRTWPGQPLLRHVFPDSPRQIQLPSYWHSHSSLFTYPL